MEHVCICCALHTLHYYCSLYFVRHVDNVFILLHLFSGSLQIFDGSDSFVCVRMWTQNCVRTWYFACSSLRSVLISLNFGDCTRNCCNYHLWRRFFVIVVAIFVGFNWHQHPGITIIHIQMHLFYQNRPEKTSSKG